MICQSVKAEALTVSALCLPEQTPPNMFQSEITAPEEPVFLSLDKANRRPDSMNEMLYLVPSDARQ